MLALVRQARQRIFHNALLAQGANSSCAALAAFILLLLVGTELLDWRLALLVPIAALAIGVYLARRRVPSQYSIAQMVDRRMDLADTLSTALFFNETKPDAPASPEVRTFQLGHAERVARTVDVRQAVPYVMPRGIYAAGALLLVASSLFALRYGLTRRLDLKPPLANILQQTFGFGERTELAKNEKRRTPKQDPQAPDENGDAAQQDPQPGGEQDQNAEAPDQQSDAQPSNAKNKKSGDSKSQDANEKNGGDDQDSQAENREGSNSDDSKTGQQNGKNGDQKQAGNQQQQNAGDNSSLWNKVKDGFQNLMSRMKEQPNNNNSAQQQASNKQDSKQGKGQQNGSKQQSKEGEQQAGNQQGDSEEGQQGESAQNSQDPQGKGQGKSDEKQASKQPGSGIGSQDGDKNIRQAEQLAAMGKISEIFGKRSQNISGESTVEVQNTAQQLRTPYANRGAQHTQGGAEISRDEIPVALQGYVEQYFEQVRKPKK